MLPGSLGEHQMIPGDLGYLLGVLSFIDLKKKTLKNRLREKLEDTFIRV